MSISNEISLATFFVFAFTLIVLWFQLQKLTAQIKLDTINSLKNTWYDLGKTLIQHPKLVNVFASLNYAEKIKGFNDDQLREFAFTLYFFYLVNRYWGLNEALPKKEVKEIFPKGITIEVDAEKLIDYWEFGVKEEFSDEFQKFVEDKIIKKKVKTQENKV